MKALSIILPLSAGIASAVSIPMHVEMPATGLFPSHACTEFTTRMGERHGGSDLAWSRVDVTLPFLDPRKSNLGDWAVDAHVDLQATLFSTGGELDLRRNELYSAALPVSFIRTARYGDDRLVLSLAPAAASDFAGTARYFDVAAAAVYSDKVQENFSYSVGLLVSPRFASYGLVPVLGFRWQLAPQWEIVLSRYKLSALYQGSERLQVGPFVAVRGGSWMVDTPEGDRIFRVSSLVAGITAEYDFHRDGERKRIAYVSIGSTIATKAGYYRRNFKKDDIEIRHYQPGFYAAVGVDFRF